MHNAPLMHTLLRGSTCQFTDIDKCVSAAADARGRLEKACEPLKLKKPKNK